MLYIALLSAARADSDGWAPPEDCDDTRSDIHPWAAEDGVDETDEDCDGALTVQRIWVGSFSTTNDLVLQNATLTPGEEVLLTPAGGVNATATLVAPVPFESGVFTVGVKVTELVGAVCGIWAGWAGVGYEYQTFSGVGYHDVSLTSVPPEEDVDVQILCSGAAGSRASIDWMTVQNGAYEWPPPPRDEGRLLGHGDARWREAQCRAHERRV
jgi:hypothetical protein